MCRFSGEEARDSLLTLIRVPRMHPTTIISQRVAGSCEFVAAIEADVLGAALAAERYLRGAHAVVVLHVGELFLGQSLLALSLRLVRVVDVDSLGGDVADARSRAAWCRYETRVGLGSLRF